MHRQKQTVKHNPLNIRLHCLHPLASETLRDAAAAARQNHGAVSDCSHDRTKGEVSDCLRFSTSLPPSIVTLLPPHTHAHAHTQLICHACPCPISLLLQYLHLSPHILSLCHPRHRQSEAESLLWLRARTRARAHTNTHTHTLP